MHALGTIKKKNYTGLPFSTPDVGVQRQSVFKQMDTINKKKSQLLKSTQLREGMLSDSALSSLFRNGFPWKRQAFSSHSKLPP